ncbi:hypothetical protein BSKO_12166 [Bryopsis sp. KO-2023]|nr:hypothetical protein BSKO_12166 [Bryopsis sp. KO-2023]
MLQANEGALAKPLLEAAGTDVSHWFDAETGDVRTYINPENNIETPYCPQGRFIHVGPSYPASDWDACYTVPWWKDVKYKVGNLSKKTRVIRVKNVLTGQEDKMEVPSEETVEEIQERYLELNWHARSYTIKGLSQDHDGKLKFKELDLKKTLDQNNVIDEASVFEDHNLPADHYLPVLQMYWADDLTVA